MMWKWVVVVLVCVWSIETTGLSIIGSTQDVRMFDLVYEVDVRNLPTKSRRVEIWIPVPTNDPNQEIVGLQIDAPYPWTIQTESEYGNSILHLILMDVDVQSIPLTLSMSVTRRENRRSLKSVADPETFDGRWLMPDRLVPLDDFVETLAMNVTRDAGTPADKARAIFDYVVDTMTYDKSGAGWGNGDLYWACDARTGNCTDFHALFIGLTRAVGIPATFEIGFPIPTDRASGEIEGYHCWVQFYLEGVGWVPVDTSEANKHPEQRDYFFGAHDAHRVLFSKGRDVTLEPPQQGPPLNYFIYPYIEVDGVAFDSVDLRFFFNDVSSSVDSPNVSTWDANED